MTKQQFYQKRHEFRRALYLAYRVNFKTFGLKYRQLAQDMPIMFRCEKPRLPQKITIKEVLEDKSLKVIRSAINLRCKCS